MDKETDSRYPYTYACDYIRGICGYNEKGTKLSRSDASRIISAIEAAIGYHGSKLPEKLADMELAKTDKEIDEQVQSFQILKGYEK